MFQVMCKSLQAAQQFAESHGFIKQEDGQYVREFFGEQHIATFKDYGDKCLLTHPK